MQDVAFSVGSGAAVVRRGRERNAGSRKSEMAETRIVRLVCWSCL